MTPEQRTDETLYSKAYVDELLRERDILRELCRDAYRELNCGEDGSVFDRTHHCGKCDNSIDRNGILRTKLAMALAIMPNVEQTS